jgi:4'-phosphopantetheinyl transferase EntD
MSKLNKTTDIPTSFFPEQIAFVLVDSGDDVLSNVNLHSLEIELANSIKGDLRRKSFILGRKASALALSKLGERGPVLRGINSEPVWPKGIIGSISHSGDFALSVVTRDSKITGIGIDIERSNESFDLKIAKRICTPQEISMLDENPSDKPSRLLKIFAAKEAFYKAVYPTIKTFLGFRDVELRWNSDFSTFEGIIVNPNIDKLKPVKGKVLSDELVIAFANFS